MPFKQRLVQLHDAQLAREKAKKQKVKQSLPTAQSENKPFYTDTNNLDNVDNVEYTTLFSNMSANESESELDKGGQLDKEEPDFESKTKAAILFQSVTKEICWNKEEENRLRDIYGRGSILSARRQKLATEKLKKKASKTYNIKALWQHNCKLGLNSKTNISVSEVAESSKSTSGKKTNSIHFFSNVTQRGPKTSVLLRQKLWQIQRVKALKDLTWLLNLVTK